MEKERIKAMYIGMHPGTISHISSRNVELVAVAWLEYFSVFTLRPFGILFSLVYYLHFKEICPILKKILWWKLSFFRVDSSNLYGKYYPYLKEIIEKNLKIRDINEVENARMVFDELSIDLVIMNSWGILQDEIVNMSKMGVVNVHPSKLPKYRGALPTLWSLKNHDTESAVTYFIVSNGIDGGKIIAQHDFPIGEKDYWYSLEEKIDKIIEETLSIDLENYVLGNIKPYEQVGESSSTGKYLSYQKIDFANETARDIYNKVGLYPYLDPDACCYTILNNRKIHIKETYLIEDNDKVLNLKAGEIKKVGGKIYAGTLNGILWIRFI